MSSEVKGKVDSAGYGSGFELIVVLFILLIIVGAVFTGSGFEGSYGC